MNPVDQRTALIYDPLVQEHRTGLHPENHGRLTAVLALLRERGTLDLVDRVTARDASIDDLVAVHDRDYLRGLERQCAQGGGALTGDTPFSRRSWDAVVRASGAVIRAVECVTTGDHRHAFALIRPPGHHATTNMGMGFCLINHAAVAVSYARRCLGLSRVLIVDFDVHHGNGTQDIFWTDPSVLYFSVHQSPAYPGTGAVDEVGEGAGHGATVNVPLPPGAGDEGHLMAMERVLAPIANSFRPELILVSAGYDAHWTNSAHVNGIRQRVTVAGFGRWVKLLMDLADRNTQGRMAMMLEGGYDPTALAWSVEMTLRTLAGDECPDPLGGPPAPEVDVLLSIEQAQRLHRLV